MLKSNKDQLTLMVQKESDLMAEFEKKLTELKEH